MYINTTDAWSSAELQFSLTELHVTKCLREIRVIGGPCYERIPCILILVSFSTRIDVTWILILSDGTLC